MSGHVFLTPEGAAATVAGWRQEQDKTYVSPQLEEVKTIPGAPLRLGHKLCTVWSALREMPGLSFSKMGTVLPHCADHVKKQEFEKLKAIIDNNACVENLWLELENSREVKRQRK